MPTSWGWYAKETTMSDAMDVSQVEINGASLAYVEQGSGSPVVMVHGSLGDHRTWAQQLEPFSRRHRVVVPSRRYHWPNEAPGEGVTYRLMQHVEDLAALIEALDLAPADVAGTSYGAMTTLTLAAVRPELVRSMVLTEPPIIPWLDALPGGAEVARAFVENTMVPAGAALARGEDEDGVRLFINGVLGAGAFDRIPEPVKAAMMDNAAALRTELATPPEVYFSSVTPGDCERIEVPALLVRGERSPAMFGMILDELARRMPDAKRVTIPAASHSPHSQNATAYNDAALTFLGRQ